MANPLAGLPPRLLRTKEAARYPGDMAEVALAHKLGSAVEQAYRRGDMLAKRRQMMSDWAAFLGA